MRYFFYKAYDLVIRTNLEIPEFQPVEGPGYDVVLDYRKDDPISFTNNDRFGFLRYDTAQILLVIKTVGVIELDHGHSITIRPIKDVRIELIRLNVIGLVMGSLLFQRSALVMHASVAELDGLGAAFLGDAGQGKSSMAAAFYACGHKVITDDIAAVSFQSNRAMVAPSFPQIRLVPQTVTGLGVEESRLEPIYGPGATKFALRIADGFARECVPLRCIYLLEYDEQNAFERISGHQAVIGLISQTFPTRLLQVGGNIHLQQIARLLHEVPVFRMKRRLALDSLRDNVARVEEHFCSLNAENR